jgi:hypothetical protein
MTADRAALVERVADIISMVFEGQGITETAEGVINTIRDEVLEEAASAMEQRTLRLRTIYSKQNNQTLAPCGDAAAIRALKGDNND